MRKLIFISVILLSFISNAQIHNVSGNIKAKSSFAFTNDDYIGYWYSKDSTHLVFWKDCNNEMQLIEFSANSGTPLELISANFNKTNLYVKSNFKENNWVTESEYTFVDSNTLKCTMTGAGNSTIIYKRVK